MAAKGATIRWNGAKEHLEFDPDRLPVVGSYVKTQERATDGSLQHTFRARVIEAERIGNEVCLKLGYREQDQSPATKRSNEAWGTSTLTWAAGAAKGRAQWVDDAEPSRSGACVMTLQRAVASGTGSKVLDKKSCEVWTGTRWEIWPVSAAYPHRETAPVRCPVCHGAIVLMRASDDARNRAHFEHRPAHTGCPLVYKQRRGLRSDPPVVVEASPADSGAADYFSEDAVDDVIGNVGETEREQQILARVGQGKFRKKLVERWGACSVTSCGPQAVLVASHIVAWRDCETNVERLDANNGLLLTPNLDKLFDRRLISFDKSGHLLIGSGITQEQAIALGVTPDMRLRKTSPKLMRYLARHRGQDHWDAIRPGAPTA